MSNVIALRPQSRIAAAETRAEALLHSVSAHRRREEDVFWLKENAELLNILECTGVTLSPDALAIHDGFYATAQERLTFFPQYYRFLISIALDLEALGLPGDAAERMIAQAASDGLAEAELSDLQRMEARRLFARRNVQATADPGLEDRLHRFAERSQTFALPNKKAAYELTHIVFYLSEYGRRDPGLSRHGVTSLHFAGNIAFLEQNSDLLSEICIALRFAGESPPSLWTVWLARQTHLFEVECGDHVALNDDYHDFLVCNWHMAIEGGEPFRKPMGHGRMGFFRAQRAATPLRELSQALYAQDDRSSDWMTTRARIEPALSPEALSILDTLAGQSDHFDAFFEGFSRAGRS